MKLQRLLCLLLTLCLLLSLCPAVQAEGNLLFVAVNDSIPLTLSALPYSSGGTLYVPYTVFDAVPGGVNQAYNTTEETFVLFTRTARLIFDLKTGKTKDENDKAGTAATTFKNGILYVPLQTCISHFGLKAVLLESAGGYPVLRFTTGSEVYDNSLFLEKAENLIAFRVEQYASGQEPQEEKPPEQPPQQPHIEQPPQKPQKPEDEPPVKEPAQVCPVFYGGETMQETLEELEKLNLRGTFFLTASEIRQTPELVRRAYVIGHKLGLRPEAEAEDTADSLHEANDALDAVLGCKSLMALVSREQAEGLDGFRLFVTPETALTAEEAAQTEGTPLLLICDTDPAEALRTLHNAGSSILLLRETTILPEAEQTEE